MNPELNPLLPAKPVAPLPHSAKPLISSNNSAARLIRQKISQLFATEPAAKDELRLAMQTVHPSKHQLFMEQLSQSGRSQADIQVAWHAYYEALPDDEKHQVWQEFYSAQAESAAAASSQPVDAAAKAKAAALKAAARAKTKATGTLQRLSATAQQRRHRHSSSGPEPSAVAVPSVSDVKHQLLDKVNTRGKLKARHHVQSLLFGLGLGSVVILVLLFGFFNERFIAPFVTPSKSVSNTPIIIDPNSTVAEGQPKVIIPKINVEIPVVYDQPSVAEADIQGALERGVVHYATTPSPGEKGNAVLFGHSSNNILNRGKYKFAFVLLNRLEIGDTFMLTKDSKRYVYRVYSRKIVNPADVSVLGNADKPASATLITCDPPGTSLNRLVVTGEQISPDPNNNAASSAVKSTQKPKIVPSDAPTLWSRINPFD